MLVFRLATGVPLDAKGPDGEVLLLILGGAIGAGLARYTHFVFATRVFGLSEQQEESIWGR
jgi:hypothetical protein